jgi:signal transduction histidine kinase
MRESQDDLLRTAGLGSFGTPKLEDVNRRRAQLWLLSLLIGLAVPAIIVAVGLDLLPESLSHAFHQRTVQLGFLALLVALAGYVAEREVALRKLTRQVLEERETALEHARTHQSMQVTIEALSDLDRMRGDFLTAATQELRTPLTSLLGVLTALEGAAADLGDERVHQLAQRAVTHGDKLDRLVDDLVRVTSLQEGMAHLAPSDVNLAALTHEVVGSVARDAAEHFLSMNVPDQAVRRVDHDTLSRILSRLLGDAVEQTPAGTAIEVAVAPIDGGVQITVSDDGTRVDEPGLGVHIARSLAEAHQGTVEVATDESGTHSVATVAELAERAPV